MESVARVEVVPPVDYAGVATFELVAVYEKHGNCDIPTLASRMGWLEQDLRQILVDQKYSFTGWTNVEKILDALGLLSGELMHRGELHEIPARNSRKNARKIVLTRVMDISPGEDWDRTAPPVSDEVIEAKVEELMTMRASLAEPNERQRRTLAHDSAKSMERMARLKG